ncbi:Uncharacterised protein [uncultured archaeon]|nr:Uncharacterised protein [uncultured archaeon]
MCKLCKEKPVYEFTNQRKLCKRCFINYFYKKVLYTVRKFNMISREDIIGYRKSSDVKAVVLEEMLVFLSKKSNFKITKLPDKKANKIAEDSSLDSESEEIIKSLISGKESDLKKYLPVEKNAIKPLYLFLDEEISLFARLKGLKFKLKEKKRSKIQDFENEFEKNHPEVKRAIVNSLLKLYNKKE